MLEVNIKTNASRSLQAGKDSITTHLVNKAIQSLLRETMEATQLEWLRAVARLVLDLRHDIGQQLSGYLEVEPLPSASPLEGMSIGEISVVYEALIALSNQENRSALGQYFTPDDVATFMASHVWRFPGGHWLDPCCGVGNLSWHLTNMMWDPADFVSSHLTLIDVDAVALKTASVLLVASFSSFGDTQALPKLLARSLQRDAISEEPLPSHDFVIANPPYGATTRVDRFETAEASDMFSYFLEKIAKESKGFITVTPSSYLSGQKYQPLRGLLERLNGGDTYVLDNVPDTCFRGYKYGSTNTSKTNFVRAAITMVYPKARGWRVTPILRWTKPSRHRMWQTAGSYLSPLRFGPSGEWVRLMPGTEQVWELLSGTSTRLSDIVTTQKTAFTIDVASTPRYYISGSKIPLSRTSKHTLHFRTEGDMNVAYLLLNSSLPYWWWRSLDIGITLSARNLLSLPLVTPRVEISSVVAELERSDRNDIVRKLNAGKQNDNVKRPRVLVDKIDRLLLGETAFNFDLVYAPDMFTA